MNTAMNTVANTTAVKTGTTTNGKLYVSVAVAPVIIQIESVRDLMVSARETVGVDAARKMLLEFRTHGVPLLVTTGGKPGHCPLPV